MKKLADFRHLQEITLYEIGCECGPLNDKLEEIVGKDHGFDFCCPLCCYCKWDSIEEKIIEGA